MGEDKKSLNELGTYPLRQDGNVENTEQHHLGVKFLLGS